MRTAPLLAAEDSQILRIQIQLYESHVNSMACEVYPDQVGDFP